MELIKNLLKIPTTTSTPDQCKYQWQNTAKQIIKAIPDVNQLNKTSSVFKCCKINSSAANAALSDCKELGKLNILYFLKVWNEINKKQNGETRDN